MSFEERLNLILKDPAETGNLDSAYDAYRSIDKTKQNLLKMQHELNSIKKRINCELAVGVRKCHPGLNVSVNRKGCKIGYKNKSMCFDPDMSKGVWIIKGSDPNFIKRFKRSHIKDTLLSPEYEKLAALVSQFFINHYKSLGEDIIGSGSTLLEDKKVRIIDVAVISQSQL
tara:strand:+ start:625 stop:1137 length:513 start_codon:yes stop_codon:yes gene_type:complete